VNPGLELDLSVPTGYKVAIPDFVLNARVVDYYKNNSIKPVSGLDDDVIITQNDLNTMKQDFDYDLDAGSMEFPKVKLDFLHDNLTVQIAYEGITADTVVASIDQSLDGENWTSIPYVNQILDRTKTVFTFNIIGLLTDYARLHIEVPDSSSGTIKSVIWKT